LWIDAVWKIGVLVALGMVVVYGLAAWVQGASAGR